ncbi:HSP20-like chaperone [Xylariales sp. AK1849]|nr:HSP20-like chaperone [Xylariales sp. AK1849]
MHALAGHPFAQGLREYVTQARSGAEDATDERPVEQDDTFVPPIDIFNTEKAYILHISLPGAVKEDVGVNWDSDKNLLNVAGVVHRPGNEEFLQSLASSERKVGMFERSVKLPPSETDDKEEVDGFGITAKMENGILIVTVPKAEKEWTEIHKIDVE